MKIVKLARLERFELPTFWFVARHSIQLSYRRAEAKRIAPAAMAGAGRGGITPNHILLILQNFAATFGPVQALVNSAAGRALKPKGPG